MKNTTKGNQVKFLLDGQEFFEELARQLDRVKNATPSDDTYVRMAFWSARADCRTDTEEPHRTLQKLLHAVADGGHSVQFICWMPDTIARAHLDGKSHAGSTYNSLTTLKKALAYRSKKEVEGADKKMRRGSVRVYLEEYRGWFLGASTHQKIAIFAVKGVLTVIIGGLNLLPDYYAPVSHGEARPSTSDFDDEDEMDTTAWTWHDTAVEFTGPATIAVEQEWLRRWRKQSRFLPRPVEALAATQPVVQDGTDLTILTTNSERLTRETDIRAALCERISRAEYYVYLENYVLSDPIVVSALAERLRANPKLVVLFVTGLDDDVYSLLNRMSYLKLIIAAGGEGRVEYKKGRDAVKGSFVKEFKDARVLGGDFTRPDRVDQLALLRNPFMAKDVFQYTDTNGKTARVALQQIVGGYSPRVAFCSPDHPYINKKVELSLYVHSKLVLVDDDTAFIGSANLSYRSMVYDGEICACISGAAAKDIRDRLFKHYGLDFADKATIQAKLISTVRKPKKPPKDSAYLVGSALSDFITAIPSDQANHTWH